MGSVASKQTPELSRVATPENIDDFDQWKAYDFVIVGGGTAGCVLASRLSENRDATILLIEAGKSHEGNLLSKMPAAFAQLLKTEVDWDSSTIPQKNLNNKTIPLPRGRILGGSSAINCVIYHRCSPEDFGEWVRNGAEGWSYEELLPYFIKSEGFCADTQGKESSLQESVHGFEGPWKTGRQVQRPSPIHEMLVQTCDNLRIRKVMDLCAPSGTLGAAEFMTFTDRSGTRSTSATAYLTSEVLKRPNLTVLTEVHVERILFSTASARPRAVGVEISSSRNGPKFRVRATKEVLLCAGAMGTPQILMVSGLGPRKHLEEKDVKVVVDLPAVGQHLSDHVSSGPLFVRTKVAEQLTLDYLYSPLSALFAVLKWLTFGRGPMAGLAVPGAAFLRSDNTEGADNVRPVRDNSSGPSSPDLEILWTPMAVVNWGKTRPPKNINGVTFAVINLKPLSEGTITIRTNSAWDDVAIDPNYLASENDRNVLLRGIRFVLSMTQTTPLDCAIEREAKDADIPWLYPGNKAPDSITDDELNLWLTENGFSAWHTACTARMGQSADTSVVNHELKVHGVDGLRVVDASVFPSQVSGHPCAVVIAVAEKAADVIRHEWE